MKRYLKLIPALLLSSVLLTSVSASGGSGAAPNFSLPTRDGGMVSLLAAMTDDVVRYQTGSPYAGLDGSPTRDPLELT